MNLFVNILCGHVLGDFIFQPAKLAVKKGSSNLLAALHCLIYTICLCSFTSFKPSWVLFIFASHFVVDRFSIADFWLKLIGGRYLPGFIKEGQNDIPSYLSKDEKENYRILRGAFAAICYVIVDNSIHIFSAYYCYNYFV